MAANGNQLKHAARQAVAGLQINRSSTMVYSPTGNYEGVPAGFTVGSIESTIDSPPGPIYQ
jgi:hypothetical protein